ncbi:hypothetical protein [Vulgatibacter incomptus]|uniref:pyroglutamyl-peptidase I family protein n=1 Tax=Vulgatibacter incomptus TaxID=1391653 RepID=UPI000683090E|nr:hypothetical protein [Vulgatibacter incomptus]
MTAFEPFGGRSINRSQLVLEHIVRAAGLPKGVRGGAKGARVVARTLPVSFSRLGPALARALACKPDVVLLLGESREAEQLRLERVAVNRIHARIADNDGMQPIDRAIVEEGPAAYFSTVRPKSALVAVRRSGTAASLSNDAGTFACNAAYYLALHRLHRRQGEAPPAIFIHIPTKGRSLALRDATRGVLSLLRHLVDQTSRSASGARRAATGNLRASPAGGRKS